MIWIYIKQKNDGGIELLILHEGVQKAIHFDSLFFTNHESQEFDLSSFSLLKISQPLRKINEIRCEEDVDVNYLRVNDDIIIQISWINRDGDMIQHIGIYDKQNSHYYQGVTDSIYNSTYSRFIDAEVCEEIDLDDYC